MAKSKLSRLLERIRACEICTEDLPLGPRPVLRAHPSSRILIIGQAPGTAVHASGIPWDDPSGRRLRQWLDVSEALFYNEEVFGIVPMGFCYPGKGKGGDLPPRPECAPEWHPALLELMPKVELILLIGRYALDRYLTLPRSQTLTQTVQAYREFAPKFLPLPHPSPRNNRWIKNNPWFEAEVVPYLRERIKRSL